MLIRSLLLLGACLLTAHLLTEALPLDSEQPETLLSQEGDQLPLEDASEDVAVVREKRTIGFLRQAFPTLSQIIDRKIQAITRLLFRLIGRLVLRGGGGGGGNSDSSDDDDRRVQITLPTFPPSADDDEDEDEDESTGSSSDDTTTTTETSEDSNSVVSRRKRQTSGDPAASAAAAATEDEYEDDDQAAAATGDNEVAGSAEEEADDAESAESEANETEDPRNKRFLSLGGSGGSGGGSGNFLFDIIRLVAGSGTTQGQDEADNAPLDDNATHSGKADDGYSAGVPGPLTRLFVIANRGIANLIQDLILRLAQTSERIVNFKARLITSII